ncbi:glycosyltransferase family 1 protein [uncultured Schumannella sp.]|uniref:glycosyltransferase family 4 protein n=1 Tax=uncultured Schumannella sp. TaxID=1195956 RepID=UPI0025DCA28B|nr:glycosyltransferase family 1 protein [uncultured Schumannella sp.]
MPGPTLPRSSGRHTVLVDATSLPANLGGVGRYLEKLIPELAGTDWNVVVAVQPRDVDWLERIAPDTRPIVVGRLAASRPGRLVWEQAGLPALARRIGADVIHSPHYTMPLLTRRPVVVTLHDATFFSHPELHGRLKRRFFRAWSRVALRRASACLVPSEATRDELERYLGARARSCRVIPHGVDRDDFFPPTDDARSAAERLVGVSTWIMFLGTIEPRKNVPALIRGYLAARSSSDSLHESRLVLAGGAGWDDSVERLVNASGGRVVRLGYVEKSQLPGLLGGAALVAYPSLGEGFGLPVLEAMACGAAVLTTRLLALPEVGGDAVAYTEPDPESIAAALTALMADEPRRQSLRQAAITRASSYTWARAASDHRAAFEFARTGAAT